MEPPTSAILYPSTSPSQIRTPPRKHNRRQRVSSTPIICLTSFRATPSDYNYNLAHAATGEREPYWFREDPYGWNDPCWTDDEDLNIPRTRRKMREEVHRERKQTKTQGLKGERGKTSRRDVKAREKSTLLTIGSERPRPRLSSTARSSNQENRETAKNTVTVAIQEGMQDGGEIAPDPRASRYFSFG